MPFGLCNVPVTFERLLERVLAVVPWQHCVVYLDDLLVHADSLEGVLNNLKEVFSLSIKPGCDSTLQSAIC